MSFVRVRAHAKINWTLEVLGKRSDGYHEIRSIMQTIGIADFVTLHEATSTNLSLYGHSEGLTNTPQAANLAYRAAMALSSGSSRAVRIELEKHIPIAAGLGGGSSDAAAVLRGLCALWRLDVTTEELLSIAADLGSDVPFFLHGGTALVSGRGEAIEQLPEVPSQAALVIALDEAAPDANKTSMMYAALKPEHYTDGGRTAKVAARIRAGQAVREEDVYNVFERIRSPGDWGVETTNGSTLHTGHMCGSGPTLCFVATSDEEAKLIARGVPSTLNMRAIATHTAGSAVTTTIEELD